VKVKSMVAPSLTIAAEEGNWKKRYLHIKKAPLGYLKASKAEIRVETRKMVLTAEWHSPQAHLKNTEGLIFFGNSFYSFRQAGFPHSSFHLPCSLYHPLPLPPQSFSPWRSPFAPLC
jgi:hypothetical protein